MFWKHHNLILSNQADCEENVKSIVATFKDELLEQGDMDGKNYAMIKPTNLAIGNYSSGKPPQCWIDFDYIINCSVSEYDNMNSKDKEGCYLHLPIPEGKKGQIIFGTSIQKAIDFVQKPILENKKILVHCSTGKASLNDFYFLLLILSIGKDYSVGILLAIMIHYFDLNGELITTGKSRGKFHLF
jgi:tRNA A64-2'-O-ribosylphosphate transferase